MNIDKLLGAIPSQTKEEQARSRANAVRLLETGSEAQRGAAEKLLAALDAHVSAQSKALYDRLNGAPIAKRVVEAFQVHPLSDNERKTVQALLDHPGSSSTELSRACGHDNMIWQMHFGNLCKDRQAYLWPAEQEEGRDAPLFSGILAEITPDNRFTMKPDVAAAFADLGLVARTPSTK
jgi:hypothetical protein